VFRILGDISHILSKCILIFAIHRNRSAEGLCSSFFCSNILSLRPLTPLLLSGVSLITQALYALVFCTRYTDIFSESSTWNRFFKFFYIISSFYIIGIMQWIYPRTREREVSWKIGAMVLGGSLVLSPFIMLIFETKGAWGLFMVRPMKIYI
jgi:hypothetical protein